MTDAGIDIAVPDIIPPDAAVPVMTAPDSMETGEQLPENEATSRFDIAEDMPLVIQDEAGSNLSSGTSCTPAASGTPADSNASGGIMDMGSKGAVSGSSHGSAADALANPVTIRIFNQKGIYYDSVYYMNIGFINRYETGEDFVGFINKYIR